VRRISTRRTPHVLPALAAAAAVIGILAPASSGTAAVSGQVTGHFAFGSDWPVYHHDGLGSGFDPSGTNLSPAKAAWNATLDGPVFGEPLVEARRVIVATENDTVYELAANTGQVLAGTDGGVFSFNAPFAGSVSGLGVHVNDIVGMAYDAATGGYWLVGSDGGVFSFNAPYQGSVPGLGIHVNNIVGMAYDAATGGYWLVGRDGGVFAFHAPDAGSVPGLGVHISNVVGMAADATTAGYWLVGNDGGVFAFNAPPIKDRCRASMPGSPMSWA
jgi:hypothetical protein